MFRRNLIRISEHFEHSGVRNLRFYCVIIIIIIIIIIIAVPKTMPQATNLKVVRELEPSPVGPGTILNHVLSISAAIKDR